MKFIPFFALLILVQNISRVTNAQALHTLLNLRLEDRVSSPVSPTSIIDRIERQLSSQFTTPIARHATVSILIGEELAARGTVLSGFHTNFSYLVCPAHVLHSGSVQVQTSEGEILEWKERASLQLLSKRDNLAIVRVPFVPGGITLSALEPSSEVGSFIGILGKEHSWKTGTVTNQMRSALSQRGPRMQHSLQKHWNKIGLRVSERRSGFPEVIESDLDILPDEAGSPVFDRHGTWQGIAIARADRHSTLLIPALRVADLIRSFEETSRS